MPIILEVLSDVDVGLSLLLDTIIVLASGLTARDSEKL